MAESDFEAPLPLQSRNGCDTSSLYSDCKDVHRWLGSYVEALRRDSAYDPCALHNIPSLTGASTRVFGTPTPKSPTNRLKKLTVERRVANRRHESESGIVEVNEEKEQLLHDIIMKMDEKAADDRLEKEEKDKKDMVLCNACAVICSSDLKRRDRTKDSDGKNTEEPARKRIEFGMDAEILLIEEEAYARSTAEESRKDIEEKRFALDVKRDDRDELRV